MILNQWLLKIKVNVDIINSLLPNTIYNEIDIEEKSTEGKLSRQWEFTNCDVLVSYIRKELDKLEQEFFDIKNTKWTSGWMVEGYENSYHRMHRHTPKGDYTIKPSDKDLATIIYTDVPENKDDRGELFFMLKKDDDIILDTIIPEKGDMIIMPCTVYHGVYPQGPGKRKTINLDFKHINA